MYYIFRTVDGMPTELLLKSLQGRKEIIEIIIPHYPGDDIALYLFTMTDEGGVMVEVSMD